ncbi:MAG: TlpA family protein disulfide reductase [Gammaproteobacteria bacterium]|nr:TlpA family protein disulfide reductase [Gammaproteobacteria bacterium]MDH5802845.1 TlpA family protein disulfide reductase [Gammaproteobacteria bacterium]
MIKTLIQSVPKNAQTGLIVIGLLLSTGVFAAISGVLKDFNGNIKTLDDYTGQGQWVVLMFWASDCSVCNKEVHQYVALHKKHLKSHMRVLGVSLDGDKKIDAARDFLKKHQVNFPNLITDPATGARLYELSGDSWIGTPSFMVFKPNGELVGAQTGAVPANVIESFITREVQAQVGAK